MRYRRIVGLQERAALAVGEGPQPYRCVVACCRDPRGGIGLVGREQAYRAHGRRVAGEAAEPRTRARATKLNVVRSASRPFLRPDARRRRWHRAHSVVVAVIRTVVAAVAERAHDGRSSSRCVPGDGARAALQIVTRDGGQPRLTRSSGERRLASPHARAIRDAQSRNARAPHAWPCNAGHAEAREYDHGAERAGPSHTSPADRVSSRPPRSSSRSCRDRLARARRAAEREQSGLVHQQKFQRFVPLSSARASWEKPRLYAMEMVSGATGRARAVGRGSGRDGALSAR